MDTSQTIICSFSRRDLTLRVHLCISRTTITNIVSIWKKTKQETPVIKHKVEISNFWTGDLEKKRFLEGLVYQKIFRQRRQACQLFTHSEKREMFRSFTTE